MYCSMFLIGCYQQFSNSSGSFDLIRTTRMAAYGLLLLGPSQHVWFNFLSKALPKRDVLSTLKKTFMGQAIYGPANAVVFFSYNAALQGKQISLSTYNWNCHVGCCFSFICTSRIYESVMSLMLDGLCFEDAIFLCSVNQNSPSCHL